MRAGREEGSEGWCWVPGGFRRGIGCAGMPEGARDFVAVSDGRGAWQGGNPEISLPTPPCRNTRTRG